MSTTPGEEFARAIAGQDPDGLRAVLADQVDFAALTPGHRFSSSAPDEVVDEIILGVWFGGDTHIRELRSVSNGEVAGRAHVRYQLGLERGGSDYVVEQQAYYDAIGGRITWMRVLCAGYLPDPTRQEAADVAPA